ncbi:outer membrane lipoprotein carrier protein LolA [Herbiconiux sp. P15]|uniref:LolA family protein n=1 Tax=Herbiconiux liukaitaii TaxID=3342799 RepID=UPI0035B7F219
MSRNWQRWIPAVAVPAVVAVVAVTGGVAASASADLPEKTPQEVLALVGSSDVTAFSGTIEQSSDLGLPDVSALSGGTGGSGGSGSGSSGDSTAAVSGALELATGSHTARVYADGPENLRVQVLDQLAERDAVRNGDDLWLYDSDEQTAVHATLPERDGAEGADVGDGAALPGENGTVPTPDELATRFLDAVDPSTDVSLGSETTVAGRDAYALVLTPRTDDTLVGSVTIAVDAETGMPLEVQVFARGSSSAAFEVGFTDLSLDTPSADLFEFSPPAGTEVTEKEIDGSHQDASGSDSDGSADASAPGSRASGEPTVIGSGWGAIVETALQGDLSELTSNPLFAQLATPVDGGSVLQTTLVSVLLTDDGRVLAGAVPAELLQQAAAE